MAERTALVGKDEKIIDIERKDGLLEELNLPPHVIKFIRGNARILQLVAGGIVLLIFAWTYYDYYTQTRENQASSALSLAVQEDDGAVRSELLRSVAADFSGTGAARWSRIEQAHVASQAGNYDDALALYNDIFAELEKGSPLLPLLSYNIGLTFENSGEHRKALTYYEILAKQKGFAVKGLMAQGRIYELLEEKPEALRVYREASGQEALSGPDKSLLTEKINALQAGAAAGQES